MIKIAAMMAAAALLAGCSTGGGNGGNGGSSGNPRADIENIPAADYPPALFTPAWDGSGGAQ